MRCGEEGVRGVILCGMVCEFRVRDRDTLLWFRVFDHARKRLGCRASGFGGGFFFAAADPAGERSPSETIGRYEFVSGAPRLRAGGGE